MKAHLPLDVPGPNIRTVIGRLRQALRFGHDSIDFGRRLFAEYGPIVALARGGRTRLFSPRRDCPGSVIVHGPDLLKEVATKHDLYHKFHLSGVLHPLGDTSPRKAPLRTFAAGLFGVNGEEHRRHRKLMAPAFYPGTVATYADAMVAIVERCLSSWRTGQPRNVALDMQDIAREIASECLFGEPLAEYGADMTYSVQQALLLVNQPLVRLLRFDLPGLPYRKLLNLTRDSYERARTLIARRRAQPQPTNDALSMLLRAHDEADGPALTEEELIGHLNVLFAAGHETSANALTWTLFLLSQHPEIHSALADELRSELRGAAALPENFEQLPLLDRVVKESLRILPPVPWNGRILSGDAELGGYSLPAGTEVMASIYHTHHLPEIFTHPEVFRPERFETQRYTGYEYNPFSAGQRICIGAGFAVQEIKIVLSLMLQRFRVELAPGQVIDRRGTIVMFPRNGMTMQIEPVGGDYCRGVGGVRGNVRDMVRLPA